MNLRTGELPKNRKIYICSRVFDKLRDMNYIHHDSDGDLLITCSGSDHDFSNPEEVRVVGFGHLISRDASIKDVPDLLPGSWAERKDRNSPWCAFKNK